MDGGVPWRSRSFDPQGYGCQCQQPGAIALAKNPVFHNRSKHIDIQYHYTCGFVKEKKIQLEYILMSKGVCQRPCGPCTDHRARAVAWTAVFYCSVRLRLSLVYFQFVIQS